MLSLWKHLPLCTKLPRNKDPIELLTRNYSPAKLRNLVSELRNAAILDSGALNTVTGESQINTYIDSLEEAEKTKVRCRESKNS